MNTLQRHLSIGLVLLLSACGGGSGGGNSAVDRNQAPVAEAGEAQSARPGFQIILDGSASSDPDGSIATWEWSQQEGPEVTLIGAATEQALFTVPDVQSTTELLFFLRVTDDAGAADSDSVRVTVEPVVGLARYTLSGSVEASGNQALDSDINNPQQVSRTNNSIETAQSMSNPITLGGYINEVGAGDDGSSKVSGDPEDYFRVELLAGQSITMLVGDYVENDADLYLYNSAGEIVDSSIDSGEIEQVSVTQDGSYFVNASIFSGATNYILAIGSNQNAAGLSPSNIELVPWQAVVHFEAQAGAGQATPRASAESRMELERLGGGSDRASLLAMKPAATSTAAIANRLGAALHKRGSFTDDSQRERWETLLTIKSLRRLGGVLSAQPNYRLQTLAVPNDEAYRFQWHLPLIKLPAAWEYGTGSPEVVVAVVDTGILGDHPDLRGQLVAGFDFVRDRNNALDGDGIDPDPSDPGSVQLGSSFHGSHVSGTIAAAGNNRIGVAGVAYDARVMPLRALGADGSGTSYDVLQAVRYAAGLPNDSGQVPAKAADVINLSLGGGGFSATEQQLYRQLYDADIVVVAAAGNEGNSRPSYPAAYQRVISVSAVDALRRLTNYSNFGTTVDIAAPGGDNSADFNGDGYPDGVLSTAAAVSDGVANYAYTFLNGTSMAAPHVAGVIALMKSANPTLSAADIDAMLTRGELTDDLGSTGRDDLYGYGLVNASNAVAAALAASGSRPADNPLLVASTSALNFSLTANNLEILFSNAGRGDLAVTAIDSDQSWLSIEAAAVDDQGLGSYLLTADRSELAAGVHSARVTARSTVNTASVQVLVSVAGEEIVSDLGPIYILLIDELINEVAYQAVARTRDGSYSFNFSNVPAGNYSLIAGTDNDNDLFICDAGDACGAWLTTDQPIQLQLDTDREDIAFPIEFQVSIPTLQQASGTTTAARPKWRRKERAR